MMASCYYAVPCWQYEMDRRPAIEFALQPDSAIVGIDHGLDKTQAEARAPDLFRAGMIGPEEPFKYAGLRVGGNADAVVRDVDHDVIIDLFGANPDRAAGRCKLDGILDQVVDGLYKLLAVARD